MNKLMKIVGGSLAVLALGVGVTAGAAVFLSERKRDRIVDVAVAPVALASSDLQRGEYLFSTRGCSECHGKNGGGAVMVEDPKGGLLMGSPNITPSASSVAAYSDVDWLRLLRHGVKPSGAAGIHHAERGLRADGGRGCRGTSKLPPQPAARAREKG